MSGCNKGQENPSIDGFVPATQWNELRQRFVSEPSQTRGLRSLTAALEAENPEMSDRTLFPIRRGNRSRVAWQPDKTAVASDEVVCNRAEFDSTGTYAFDTEVDVCFASDRFMDHLEWSLQTIDLRSVGNPEGTLDLDLELGLMEAVQDLSRIVARGTARRAERRSVDR